MTWTPAQIEAERNYRMNERLGMLIDQQPLQLAAVCIAREEADAWAAAMKSAPPDEKGQLALL
jgi:hypothetical protein